MRTALASSSRTAGQMVLAALVAAVVSAVALAAISRVQWPAFPSSNQLHALTTVGQFACLAALFAAGWWWHRGRRRLAQGTAFVFLPAFVVATLGMPLGATKLYLFGISVDQQFRTEYVTRLTDNPTLRDMTYAGLPPFYPPGWFWIGGRAADLSGIPGWEMYKPWAITSIAIAVALAFVLWTQADPVHLRPDRDHRDCRGDDRLRLPGALQRDHLGAAAAGPGAGLVGHTRR